MFVWALCGHKTRWSGAVDDDRLVIDPAALDVANHLPEGVPSFDTQTALAFVRVGLDDSEPSLLGVFADRVTLVLRGVLLVLGRHSHVLGCGLGGVRFRRVVLWLMCHHGSALTWDWLAESVP